MSDVKVTSIATIKFMSNNSIVVNLSSASDLTARKIDVAAAALYKKLIELRSIERRNGRALIDKREKTETQAKLDEENRNAR